MKNMKKALSLFLALSMLLTVCAVNVLADDTVTLTVPNGNFANLCTLNGTLPDGWISKPLTLTVGNANASYEILTTGSLTTGYNNPIDSNDKTGGVEFLYRSGAGGFPAIESPKISLGGALTENKEFTLTVDYYNNIGNAALLFYNAEGKLYNGSEWVDELKAGMSTTAWQLTDATGNPSYIAKAATPPTWKTMTITAIAPVGTSSVSAFLVGQLGGSGRVVYDNVGISYKSLAGGPQPVTNLAAVAGDGQIILSWALPSITTDYAGVSIAVKNGSTLVDTVDVMDAAATSKVITGLTNGVEYTFEVTSVNADKSMSSTAVTTTAAPEAAVEGVVKIPNGDFEHTVAMNASLTDGWTHQIYVQPDAPLLANFLYYAIYSTGGNGSSAPGSNSLEMKSPGSYTGGGYTYSKTALIVQSPVISLASTLTVPQRFTYTFDYKCVANNFNTAILFYNADGKVYNGSEWIDLTVTEDANWRYTDRFGMDGYQVISATTENKNNWLSSQIVTEAPVGTSGIRVLAIATGGGAQKFAIDNLAVTYEPSPEAVNLTLNVGEHGSVSPINVKAVEKGKTHTVTITPDEGYIINQVKFNGTPVEVTAEGTYTTPELNADATIDVSFTLAEEQEKIMSAPSTFTGTESGVSYGLAFATVSPGATLGEYGVLFSETELDGESFVIGAEGVFDGKAVTAANAKGQYGIKLAGSLISGKTYYTRAYAKYGENYIYSDRIITVVIP